MTERHPDPADPQDPYATQTWSSDTWDTTYQPTVAPGPARPGPEAWPEPGTGAPAPAGDGPWPAPRPETAWPEAGAAGRAPADGRWPAPGAPDPAWPAAGTAAPAPGGPAADSWPDAPASDRSWAAPAPGGPGADARGWPAAGGSAADGSWTGAAAPAAGWPGADGSASGAWPPAGDAAPGAWSAAGGSDAPGSGGALGGVPAQHTPWPERAPATPSWAQPGTDGAGFEQPAAAGRHRGAPTPSEGDDLYGRLAPDAAAETAYLPPVRETDGGPGSPYPSSGSGSSAGNGSPYPSSGGQGSGTGTSYPSPAAPEGAAAETAYLPPVRDTDAAETAYLPPVRDTDGAETAYLPPVREAEGGAGAGGPEYSSPVTLGNTRIKDPQEARAQGRSPIIDPGPQSALLTAALGVLLAGAAAVGQYALLLPLVALQALTAAGWFRLNGMWPARQGIALAFLGGLVADGAVLATGHGPAAVLGTLGVWVLLTLVLQLRSHADPDERVYGLMASVASAALAVLCAGYLVADHAAVTAGALAVAVAAVVRALPLPPAASVAAALLAATGAGLVAGGVTDLGASAALVGLGAGVCALVGLRVAAYDYPSKFVHMTAGVALPLAAAAPAVHLLGRVVGG